MKRRREGSCEYSRRNNEARRCGKMTEFPVTFVSSSASEASSRSDDILCPPPGWKPENSSEFEASSGPDAEEPQQPSELTSPLRSSQGPASPWHAVSCAEEGSACFYNVDSASNGRSIASAVFNSQAREQCILLQDESREGEGHPLPPDALKQGLAKAVKEKMAELQLMILAGKPRPGGISDAMWEHVNQRVAEENEECK
ncbi:unnamed protein product [Sphagnum jensenii]|uniref:Uncharacterized protein n=1 Tax=Sphagnum jensenii TaxID=128206 RepID=A0ABP0XCG6_9BRYO